MTKRDYSGRQYSKQTSLLLAKSLPISVPIMPDRLNSDEYDEVRFLIKNFFKLKNNKKFPLFSVR